MPTPDEEFSREEQRGNKKTFNALTALMLAPLLLLVFPLLLLFVPSTPQTNIVPVEENSAAQIDEQSKAPEKDVPPIVWQTSFSKAVALAKKSGKPIMADFFADWCGPCKAMDAYTWSDSSVIEEAKHVIPVKINIDLPENRSVQQKYKINPLPSILWINSDGTEKARNEGALGPSDMLELMQKHR